MDIIAVGGFIAAMVAFLPPIVRMNRARQRIRSFVKKTSELLEKDCQSLRSVIAKLDEEKVADIELKSSIERIIRDSESLSLDDAQPIFPAIFGKNEKYEVVSEPLLKLHSINSNLQSAHDLFSNEYDALQTQIGECVHGLLAFTDDLISTTHRVGLPTSEVNFSLGFDGIVSRWQRMSPSLEANTMSGDSLDPYILDRELFKPLGDLCREHLANSANATRVMEIVRSFTSLFHNLHSAKIGYKNSLTTILNEIMAVNNSFEEITKKLD